MTLRRRVLLSGAVLLGLVLVLGVWWGVRVAQAASALQRLSDVTQPVLDALPAGDTEVLTEQLPALRTAAAEARSATEDPIVRASGHLPWLGDDVRAVAAVARAADELAGAPAQALIDLSAATDGDAAGSEDSGLDLSALVAAAPAVAEASDTLLALRSDLEGVDPERLIGPVRTGVDRLSPLLAADPTQLRTAADLAARLPELLASGGERRYLLLAMNPAELRTQGGIVGSVVVLTVRDGVLTLTDQRGTADLPELDTPALPLTEQETALYGDRLGRWIQDVVLSPDFPRAAQLAAAYWEQVVGDRVDGVLATDPVALTAVLAAAGGSVTVDGRQVSPDELIGLLLREAYLAYGDPRDGDAFYARTAAAAFTALTGVMGDPAALTATAGALADQVDAGRFRLWSADPADQRALAGTPLAADFLSGADQGAAVGVFLDDTTAGKLGADLEVRVSAEIAGCTEPVPTARITVRLEYRPPADIADYPEQVLGDGGAGVPAGWIATNLSVYSARHGSAGTMTRDGSPIGGERASTDGRTVHTVTSRLAPDGSQEYVIEVPAPGGTLDLHTTPTVDAPGRLTADCAR
ncbi:DUF4012 domain-containing protein [Cellulomonas sp. RIT-PI-Y]|uniref:DUF4012 domain-containing protein n=1 Tax=Cellulomonas sp. RIT-PI-Y TaxID=3035297 RepID=UPI0021DB6F16|nr:DUF4012 domain-containing protein [Cellulomonas sp. RIT-PI-Y]